MIQCRNVTKRYRGRVAIHPLDLTVSGGICGLMGANGAGKSTLLKMMAGLLKPDDGTISIAGHDMVEEGAVVRQRIGVVPEELGLFENLTVLENLELVGPIYGLPARDTKERSEELLQVLGLRENDQKLVSACSYGMRKKTALAMALLHNPQVLLLDEPFEGIDPSSSLAIQRLLARAAERGTTVLFTSHMLPLMEKFVSRVLILKHGKLVWDRESAVQPFTAETYFQFVDEEDAKELVWLGS